MSRSYAAFTTLIRNKLNQAATTVYSVANIDEQIEEGLKEIATYIPHIVPVVFKIESRYGTCSSTSADNLIDTTKGQFKSTDDNDEKVAHNITDSTWAVISSFASTAQVGLTGDIFVANEKYRIYNRQCWNQKQLYLSDVPEGYEVQSVEYPIGQKRNWKIIDNILELDVDSVEDSNAGSTITTLPNVDVLVRFNKPHILSQLTDTAGKMAATADAAATSISATSLQAAGTIEVGEEFTIQYHRSVYVVAASATIASNTTAISFYPPLERAVASTAQIITFRLSSLQPAHEEIFADLVTSRLAINKATRYMNVTTTGVNPFYEQTSWGNDRLYETLQKMRRLVPPKVKKRWPAE